MIPVVPHDGGERRAAGAERRHLISYLPSALSGQTQRRVATLCTSLVASRLLYICRYVLRWGWWAVCGRTSPGPKKQRKTTKIYVSFSMGDPPPRPTGYPTSRWLGSWAGAYLQKGTARIRNGDDGAKGGGADYCRHIDQV